MAFHRANYSVASALAGQPPVRQSGARVAGASDARILYVHIAPNVLPLALLQLAVSMAFAITAEATLSFLGLGPPQTFSWGTILHAARLSGAWRVAWWWVIPPGVLIMLTVVSVFFISRALEVLTRPAAWKGAKAMLLDVRDLKTYYKTPRGHVRAVDGVSFSVQAGESLGLVGESGCGKTTVVKSLIRVLGRNAQTVGGQILYKGHDLVAMPPPS